MRNDRRVEVHRVTDEVGRMQVVKVLQATYLREKRWVTDPETQIPPDHVGRDDMAWFVVSVRRRPVGVLRVLYDPPLALYAKYGFELLDGAARVEEFLRDNRVAEIGRFAVIPRYRRNFMIAAALMRAATEATVARGYTHFVTDVFEDDPHSPLGFHTRVIGFHAVATHDVGELQCRSRRITLVLDLKQAYRRLRERGSWIYRYLTCDWDERLHRCLAA